MKASSSSEHVLKQIFPDAWLYICSTAALLQQHSVCCQQLPVLYVCAAYLSLTVSSLCPAGWKHFQGTCCDTWLSSTGQCQDNGFLCSVTSNAFAGMPACSQAKAACPGGYSPFSFHTGGLCCGATVIGGGRGKLEGPGRAAQCSDTDTVKGVISNNGFEGEKLTPGMYCCDL